MPYYRQLGNIPHKRHTTFKKPDGSLYAEQLVSTEGFSSISSLIYHCEPPTRIKSIGHPIDVAPKFLGNSNMQHRSFLGFQVSAEDDYLNSRKTILANDDIYLSLAAPRLSVKDYFYKNATADELIFIHKGSGILHTIYGEIPFGYGDHLIIPRGTIYQIEFDKKDNRLLILESFSPIKFPKKYLNQYGQFLEHSPYCERDIKGPDKLITHKEKGEFKILVKKDNLIYPYIYESHPFDAIGWDGCNYPFKFSIFDFEPITGRIHQPPPVHQTFEGKNFVTCAFVPRLYDYHPQSIPAPYYHSNVDSDEVLYYIDGNFMSRKNVAKGQITLHPIGIPHGPHPGTIEKSIGAEKTEELAFMLDTFNPLLLTEHAKEIEINDYYLSWR
ncbi:MAG: homogentisate 1,2-dioxygenase [Bacteroidales bacterium]